MEVMFKSEDWPQYEKDFARADAELENCGRCTGNVDNCPNSTKGYRTVITKGAEWDRYPCVAIRQCSEMLKRQTAIKMESRMSSAGLSPKFWNRKFDRFEVDDSNREAYKAARKYASSCMETRRWLLMYGNPGSGKTHLGVACIHELMGRDVQPRYIRAKDAIYQLHTSYQTNTTGELLDDINGADMMMLDDIGEENDGKDREFIASIIKSRYEAELPTILTSNLNGAALREKYGAAVFSRLEEVADVVKMDGPDYRKKIGGAK